MSSVSENISTHGSPAQKPNQGKQERQNLPGSSKDNESNGTNNNLESRSRYKRRDLGRAEWRYV